jgi:diguanylate cyclase (GGDEF)-like protein
MGFDPRERELESAEQTFEELRLSGNLPSPSGVGMRILTLTQSEDYSTGEIAETIQTDPALTGRLLKLANSAESGARKPVTTVPEATVRLGVRAVRNIALGLSLISANREGACKGFDYDRFWSDSLARAVAAESLSRQLSIGVPAEAYVCGLLSNIGTLALASVYPEEFGALLERASDPSEILAAERLRFAITHAEIAACLLREWGLPREHAEAVQSCEREARRSTDPPPAGVSDLATILRSARMLAEICMADPASETTQWTRYQQGLDALRSSLGLALEPFLLLCRAIVRDWRQWGELLTIPTLEGIGLESLVDRAGEQLAPVPSASTAGGVEQGGRERRPLELADGRPLEILVVDDDGMQLRILERYLTRLGARVTSARDGREALQLALARAPQIVVADWIMPGMDGIELCRTLRRIKLGRDMYFVVLTGREEEDRFVEAFDAGVDDYVVKPFNPKILLARMKAGKRIVELEHERELDKAKLLKQTKEVSLLNRRFKGLAMTDLLTDLRNRRYAMERLTQEWQAGTRSARPLSLVAIDIDHFKQVNDTLGHDAGDLVLKETARILRGTVRVGDDAIRFGGEEFLVLCYGTTEEQASVCAERVRAAVEGNEVRGPGFVRRVTVSLGVAQRTPAMESVDDLLKAADEAAYAAKHGGRNRVVLRGDLGEVERKRA